MGLRFDMEIARRGRHIEVLTPGVPRANRIALAQAAQAERNASD